MFFISINGLIEQVVNHNSKNFNNVLNSLKKTKILNKISNNDLLVVHQKASQK